MLKKQIRSFFYSDKIKHFSYILIGQFFLIIATLTVNYKVENIWGAEGFAIFSLTKRTTAFLVFPLLIGSGIGIPRFISFLKEKTKQRSLEILLSGIVIFIFTFSFLLIVLISVPEIITRAFEETQFTESKIIFVFLSFILGQGFYVLLFAYYRGKLEFKYSTILNITVMSVLPVILIYSSENILDYFIQLGCLTLLVLLLSLGYKFSKTAINLLQVNKDRKSLLSFGLPRVPGEIALYALDFVPVYFISLFIGLIESAYISITLLFFKMGAMLFELVGSIILPYFGKMYINKDKNYFVKKVNLLIAYGFISGIVLSLTFYFGCGYIIDSFFPSQIYAVTIIKSVFLVFPIYIMYILLRNILDVVRTKAYNSINLTIVLVLQVLVLFVGYYFNNPTIYYNFALIIPYLALGVLTFLTWLKIRSEILL